MKNQPNKYIVKRPRSEKPKGNLKVDTKQEKEHARKILAQPDAIFLGWPAGIPRPTIKEWQAAELRYKKSIRENDLSDYRCGLAFVMATYSPFVWLPFFSI